MTYSYFGPPDFRTRADYEKRKPKKNPEKITVIKLTTRRRKKRMPQLIPCSFPGCTAKLRVGNTRHFKKVHGKEPPIMTSAPASVSGKQLGDRTSKPQGQNQQVKQHSARSLCEGRRTIRARNRYATCL